MCAAVYINGVRCEGQGDLAAALDLPLSALPLKSDYDETARLKDGCLCPIAVTRLARSLRFRWSRVDVGDWMLRK